MASSFFGSTLQDPLQQRADNSLASGGWYPVRVSKPQDNIPYFNDMDGQDYFLPWSLDNAIDIFPWSI